MKKLSILFMSCFVLLCFASSSHADYFREGPVSSDFIMTEPVPAQKLQLSAQVEYVDYAEECGENTEWMPEPLRKMQKRVTLTVIPFRAAYGVTDNLSVRITVPFIHFHYEDLDPPVQAGYGIGDYRLEGLYSILKETDSSPSTAVNLTIKPASATDWEHTGLNEWPIGSGATDWMIAGIFGKKIGPIEGKAVLGFNFRGTTLHGDYIIPGTEFICSLAGVYPTGDYEYGAEVWGNFAPNPMATFTVLHEDAMMEDAELRVINISPFVRYKASTDVVFKAAVDIPVATRLPFDNKSDNSLRVFRGVNVTLGGTWTI